LNQDDLYQFPPTNFVSNPLWRQWWHMLSKVLGLGLALLSGNLQRAARESEEVSQVTETLKRTLSGLGADIALARKQVIDGCHERGYYR